MAMPDDYIDHFTECYEPIGRITVKAEQLSDLLRRLLEQTVSRSDRSAIKRFRDARVGQRLDYLKDLLKKERSQGNDHTALQEWLDRVSAVIRRRDEIIHSLFMAVVPGEGFPPTIMKMQFARLPSTATTIPSQPVDLEDFELLISDLDQLRVDFVPLQNVFAPASQAAT